MDPQLPTQHEYTTRFMCRMSPKDRVWGNPHDVEDAYVAALDVEALPEEPEEADPPTLPDHYVPFRAFMSLLGGADTVQRRKYLVRALRRYERESGVRVLRPTPHGRHVGYLHVNVAVIRCIQGAPGVPLEPSGLAEDTHVGP